MCMTLDSVLPLDSHEPRGGLDEKLVEIVNHGATSLMISIGHRTGLFDTMAGLEAPSSVEIADAAGLDERYVREWLASMTVSGLVIHDPVRRTYVLPEEHAAFLTRDAGLGNLAPLMQFISVMGTVESDIVRCFREGGGLPYSQFERFHEVMAEDSSAVVDTLLVDQVLPLAPGLAERLEVGIEVLDVGCGMGKAPLDLKWLDDSICSGRSSRRTTPLSGRPLREADPSLRGDDVSASVAPIPFVHPEGRSSRLRR